MRPLYDARVSDLGPGDLVKVECACGHAELLTAAMLATAGVGPERRVLDLGARMRCRECDERGRVVVSPRWWWANRDRVHGPLFGVGAACADGHIGAIVDVYHYLRPWGDNADRIFRCSGSRPCLSNLDRF
jgi:hypothetical protein